MSLAAALFSPAQSKVLAWLFGQPTRSYYINELIRLTGLGSGSVQRELARLFTAGLVLEERIGNLRRIRANPDSAIFGPLVALVEKSLGIAPAIQQALQPLRTQIDRALIYGSIAKGTETTASDIDLLVVTTQLAPGDLLAVLLPLEARLGRKISLTRLTTDEFAARRNTPDSFVTRVLSAPNIPLIDNDLTSAGSEPRD